MHAGSSGILADHAAYGLACRTSTVPAMGRAHRHDEVEIDLVVGGPVSYEHRGRSVPVPAGSALVFWAAHPHRVAAAGTGAAVRWLTLPLRDVLGWSIGGGLVDRLLAGEALLVPTGPDELAAFDRWEVDLAGGPGTGARRPAQAIPPGTATRQGTATRPGTATQPGTATRPDGAAGPGAGSVRAARLEMQALLERLSVRAAGTGPAPGTHCPGGDRAVALAAAGAALLAERFREPLPAAELARALHVHPATASAAFRRVLGVTPGHYLRQCRLAEAQRLLLCTDLPVADVAGRSGFGSLSAFYDAFTAELGTSPRRYRRDHPGTASPGRPR